MLDPRTKKDKIEELFNENFEKYGELGASVSIWTYGEEVISLNGGTLGKADKRPWNKNTVCPVWSATKGPAAAAFLVALDNANLEPDGLVEEVWPTLHAAQGTGLTFAHLLSHQSGLAVLDKKNRANIEDHQSVVEALETQKPAWAPGSAHGYHPRTCGFLLDEVLRRISSIPTLSLFWREKIADPNGIDFWMVMPEEDELVRSKLAPVVPPTHKKVPADEKDFYKELGKTTSLTAGAFDSPTGMKGLTDVNKITIQRLGIPSLGGFGSACGLAKMYAIIANKGKWWSRTVFSKNVLNWMGELQVDGADKVLKMPTSFTNGFMADPVARVHKIRSNFGPNKGAFGHPGAGGSHAFCDPENGISFAYVMNQMEPGVMPNQKSQRLVDALYS
ncbi:beta-lactamase family protein [Verrucomicrobiales bacterium]|nr:beta-lactamase family protein [Verrucomicrobiales bacterium]